MKLSSPLIHSLTLCIFLVIAPHAEHLPLWVSALSAMLLGWRVYLTYNHHSLPSRWLLLLITLASVAAIGIHFHSLFGREVGVTLLTLLAALKLMELRNTRDAISLIFLACFIIITHFFYSQSIATALLMCATLFVIVSTWLRIHAPNITLSAQLRMTSSLLFLSLPLMFILFILFPRVQGPLWGLPQDAYNSSGLSDTMSPGSMSKLTLSEAVAFRVSYQTKMPRRDQLYWRGPVLWNYDGRTWTTGVSTSQNAPQLDATTPPVSYSVTLEAHNKKWLYALDMPAAIPANTVLTDDFQLLNKEAVNTRLRYQVSSNLSYHANPDESVAQRQRALQLPPQLNPRSMELATSWRAAQHDDAQVVQTALRFFSENNFSYTLEPPLWGRDGVDDFLFKNQQGFCEHYASAFVYLMRAAQIPARVVTGYLGGEFNEVGNYTIVRQSDAHAWAEVWLPGRGWVRVDPTAAIATERVERNLAAAVKDNATLPYMARHPPQWLSALRFNFDALSNQWNQWVLGYDSERQFAFLTRLGMQDVGWESMVRNLVLALSTGVGLFSLYLFRHLLIRETDPVQAAWLKICAKLAKLGLPRATHEGAANYARRVALARPKFAADFLAIAQQYQAIRYGNAENHKQSQQAFLAASKQLRFK